MRVLYQHQVEGIKWLLETKRAILADDMGVGKSAQALQAAKTIGLHNILLCPPGLKYNWENEAKEAQSLVEIHGDTKIPNPLKIPYTLIVDEVHRFQSIHAKRTESMLNLARNENCQAVFLLTGTPMANGRPANLYPILRAIQHPLGKFKRAYEEKYCGAKWKPFARVKVDVSEDNRLRGFWWKCKRCSKANYAGYLYTPNAMTRCVNCEVQEKQPLIVWDATGATNLEELRKEIAPVLLRRTKEECLDLPKKTRMLRTVETSAEAKRLFRTVFQESLATFREKVSTGEADKDSEALILTTILRKAASGAKIETAIEMIEALCDEGGQVVCFTEFRDTAERIATHFNALAYTGSLSGPKGMRDRNEIVQAFQSGEQNVFIGTTGAGALGLNLTAAKSVILVDRNMTPGLVMQAEDRCHRIGQHWPVTVHWLQAFEIDEHIDTMLMEKLSVIHNVLGGELEEPIGASYVLKKLFAHSKAAQVHEHAGEGI